MTNRLYLPQVTLVAITDCDHGKTVEAMLKSLALIQPRRAILFSNVYIERPEFETIVIGKLGSARAYNEWVTWKLGNYIEDGHILLIQHDGHVIDASAWTDDFLQYDYIGAPWRYTDGRNVGNGGFSLRSAKLHHVLAKDTNINIGSPEDEIICRLFRHYLELTHGIKYAPDALAHRFSFEMHRPLQPTFGFHNYFHQPYRPPLILRRNHAMGDVIMMEPLIEHFYNQGHRVILDIMPTYAGLFFQYPYPIEFLHVIEAQGQEDTREYPRVNLDMAYEVQPEILATQAYFIAAGVERAELRRPKLYFKDPSAKLFKKYAVIHVNNTDMPHRNTRGINWMSIIHRLTLGGYSVVEIGSNLGVREQYAVHPPNETMLGYIVGNADLFIGSDSGPSHIAAACDVPSIILFGSVNPAYRHLPADHIHPVVQPCEFNGCYHKTVGTRGTDCVIQKDAPPCTEYRTIDIMNIIDKIFTNEL